MANDVQSSIDSQMSDIEGGAAPQQTTNVRADVYKLDPATKIPVSKYEGNMWQGRRNAGKKAIEHLVEGWEEAQKYYSNAQQNHRKETEGNKSGNRQFAKDRRDNFSMTENIVYATVNAVIPSIYAKNPNVEITMTDEQAAPFGVLLEHLANKLAAMRSAPGINLKPKVRKSAVRCEITNEAWVLVGWTMREDSADGAREDIARIGAELASAKDEKELERLEGELLALEESIDLLDPPGPFVRTVQAKDVLMDCDASEDDSSDTNWIMMRSSFPTNYLNARYRTKNKDGSYSSVYKASHIVDATTAKDASQVQQEIDNFKIFDNSKDDYKAYGYDDKRAYERAKRTVVWYCFDKVKRRFYLYADNDFTWPIWVFDDPYHFPDFFPLEKLQYHADPTAPRSRGEVSHYLDQQDEINTIVDELNRARTALRDNTIFNSAIIDAKSVEDIMLNSNKKMKGVKVPDGQTLDKCIMAPPMPSLQFEHLWDKSSAKQAVNMLSGVGEAMRGEQFKTNTTNQAISEYSSLSNMRLDEKRDAIEDFIGGIMSKVLFMCLQFMDQQTVAGIVGAEAHPELWKQMQPQDIRKLVQCSIEGGSTQKPTSAAKKAEALQMGQILGQFASASPYVVLLMLKMFQRAFDSIVIEDADWEQLQQGIMMQLQQGNNNPGAGAQGGDPKEEAAVQDMVKQGMPEAEARKRVASQKPQQQQQQ